jgi:hypothetical protein
MINGVDLILTVFWSADGSVEGALQEPDAYADCLWPIDMNKMMLATMVEGSAVRVGSWNIAILAGAVCVSIAGLLF